MNVRHQVKRLGVFQNVELGELHHIHDDLTRGRHSVIVRYDGNTVCTIENLIGDHLVECSNLRVSCSRVDLKLANSKAFVVSKY